MNNLENEIEGLGEDEGATWGDCSIDTLFIRHNMDTVNNVVRRLDQGFVITNPDFRRAVIWDDAKQSKLIKSVLMGIPLPAFYLAEDYAGRMAVVDGVQRFATLSIYIKNGFSLNLPHRQQIHKKKFDDLSPKFQNRIEDSILVLYIMNYNVPERYRLDIFKRVNGG